MILNKKIFLSILFSIFLFGVVIFFFWGTLLSWLYPGGENRVFWVEVVVPEVLAIQEVGSMPRTLKTGDEVREGATIEVKRGGVANLYFSDGSVARLDSETRVIVHSAFFKKEKNILVVSLELVAGRVWSKVVSLITPESLWEVRTSNAVAVVRGTAFGVEYAPDMKKGVTRIIGGENSVTFGVLDPKTKKMVRADVGIITPNTYTEITDEIVEDIKEHEIRAPQLIVVRETPNEILNQQWIQRSLEQDRVLEENVRTLKPGERYLPEFIPNGTDQRIREDNLVVSSSPSREEPDDVSSINTSVDARARNNKRKSDLNIIVKAINQNITDNGFFKCESGLPSSKPSPDGEYQEMGSAIKDGDGYPEYNIASCLVPKYVLSLPFDPKDAAEEGGGEWTSVDDYYTDYEIRLLSDGRIQLIADDAELGEIITVESAKTTSTSDASLRNETRKKDVAVILDAVRKNIVDNKGVFCPDGFISTIPMGPTEMGDNNDGDEYDIARCLVPSYLSRLPVDPDPTDADLHWRGVSDYLTGYDIVRQGARVGVIAPQAELGEPISKFEFIEAIVGEASAAARNEKRKKDVAIIIGAIRQNSIDGGGIFGGQGAKSCVGVVLPVDIYNIAKSPFGSFPNLDLSCLVPTYIPYQIPTDPHIASDLYHFWRSRSDYFTGYQIFTDQANNRIVVFSPLAESGEKIEAWYP